MRYLSKIEEKTERELKKEFGNIIGRRYWSSYGSRPFP
jgi:hypothetical protein